MENLKDYAELFKDGKIGVIPTDTIYGVSASVFLSDAVDKIYEIKGRDFKKPCIVLVGSWDDLEKIGIEISEDKKNKLKKLPEKSSVILPCQSQKFAYLHRGKNALAVRLPGKTNLLELLKITGPLISTSANPEGLVPAKNIQEAKKYFGNKVDFYFDEGELDGKPSKLYDFTGEEMREIPRIKR